MTHSLTSHKEKEYQPGRLFSNRRKQDIPQGKARSGRTAENTEEFY